jgi:alkylhydroperoxidase family enzyme
MARIDGIDPESADDRTRAVFDAQTETWGAPLRPHLVYARRPTIYRAVRGMWGGLAQSGLLSATTVAMINRRVASLVGCVF